MRYFEVEDRAVAWVDPDNAYVFSGEMWRETSVSFARKTILDGTEIGWAGLALQFPRAAAMAIDLEAGLRRARSAD